MPRTMKASEFKAKCLHLMDEVAETGEAITITKNGKPVAKLVPAEQQPRRSLLGLMKGRMTVHGDLDEPIDVEWDALK
jgi:prevent-host-death family protein